MALPLLHQVAAPTIVLPAHPLRKAAMALYSLISWHPINDVKRVQKLKVVNFLLRVINNIAYILLSALLAQGKQMSNQKYLP